MAPRLLGQNRKLLKFFFFLIPKRDLDTKKTPPNIDVFPESLGAMLEYWYIESGLLRTSLSCGLVIHVYPHPSKSSRHIFRTAAIMVSKTMKRRPCWCTKSALWNELFSYENTSFFPIYLESCCPREWKHAFLHASKLTLKLIRSGRNWSAWKRFSFSGQATKVLILNNERPWQY